MNKPNAWTDWVKPATAERLGFTDLEIRYSGTACDVDKDMELRLRSAAEKWRNEGGHLRTVYGRCTTQRSSYQGKNGPVTTGGTTYHIGDQSFDNFEDVVRLAMARLTEKD